MTVDVSPHAAMRSRVALLFSIAAVAALSACGGGNHSSAPASAAAPTPTALTCDDSMKTAFAPDANTTVTLVKAFKKGDFLNLTGATSGPTADNDLCLVKLNVGPGNPGPASAPSTSSGIGIEVWLPSAQNWNGRIHATGGGGYVGNPQVSSLTQIAGVPSIASGEGAVTSFTDTGHVSQAGAAANVDGAFAMNPDGGINTTLWTDFSYRGLHEQAVQTKALAHAYYLKDPTFSYFDGCSTGGRQAHSLAQVNPQDYDGILGGDGAISWTRFETYELYPQIVMQRDLGGVPLTPAQLALVSSAAISACDATLTGQHEGYISEPAACHYDPTKDPAVLCVANGGTNATAACVTPVQALAMNKMWYGQTTDGSVPDPAASNGYSATLDPNQLWFGVPRGTQLVNTPFVVALALSVNGVPMPFPIAADQVALNLQDPRISTPAFQNATGIGADGWKALAYHDLATATYQGDALQSFFGNINANDPDLSKFQARNGKMIAYHGMADQLIPEQGSENYYVRASDQMGGFAATQKFYKYFPIPGMGHCAGVGNVSGLSGVSPAADPPLPTPNQLYTALTDWVEKGISPDNLVLSNASGTKQRPLCAYPKKLAYIGGDVAAAASFACR
jgi:feruloyl esterase